MEISHVNNLELLGHRFTSGDEAYLNYRIFSAVDDGGSDRLLAAHYNLHALYLMQRDCSFRSTMQRNDLMWIDGMAVIWILKFLGQPVSANLRTTFLDWQESFFLNADKRNARIFLLGSSVENIQSVQSKLKAMFPRIELASHHGYFEMNDEIVSKNLVAEINRFDPGIVLVGMGMPRQEQWIAANVDELQAKVILPLGGYFDYLAGETFTPPRWSGKLGLEWLFRLVSSPRRLGFRYLVEPWFVAMAVMKEKLRK